MKIKKSVVLCFICIILMSLAACSASKKEITGNQKFVNNFEKAINTRWSDQDKISSQSEEDTNKKNIEIIEKEIKTLEENLNLIDDPILKKNAEDYIEGSKKQIESMKTQDYELMYMYKEESDSLRKPALMSMVETYGVKIKPEYEQIYNDFKAQATVMDKENKARSYAEALGTQIKFEKITKDYGTIILESIVENTSDFDFESISYNVQYKDANDIVVDNDKLYINNFTKGQKQKVELMVLHDNEYENILITLDSVYIK